MKRIAILVLAFCISASASHAACYADYKAKKDNPLRLHYGVVQLPQAVCAAPNSAPQVVAARIAQDGWTLLNVLSVFGNEGLAQRRESAAGYFLRY